MPTRGARRKAAKHRASGLTRPVEDDQVVQHGVKDDLESQNRQKEENLNNPSKQLCFTTVMMLALS